MSRVKQYEGFPAHLKQIELLVCGWSAAAPLFFGFWLIEIFRIEMAGFSFQHKNTSEVPGLEILTTWCHYAFWMSPEGHLSWGVAEGAHEPTQYPRNESWSLLSVFPFRCNSLPSGGRDASPRHCSLRTKCNEFLQTLPKCDESWAVLGLLLAQKPWAHWL